MSPDTTVDAAPLRVRRTFDAPREEVWQAWTDPPLIAEWWSPEMFDVPSCTVDMRPGGHLRIDMRAPNGTVYPKLERLLRRGGAGQYRTGHRSSLAQPSCEGTAG